jgi:parvulin-like peptidyl-prolyl isomerase
VVLCELQGRSRQQAAKDLRIGEGTLSSRLARARKLLRDRLTKRGFTLLIPTSVAVSTKLTAATVELTNGAGGVVPAAVSELAQEALKAMTISKLKLGAVLTAMAVGFTGFGLTSHGDDVKPPAKADPQVKPVAANEPAAEKPKGRLELSISLKSGSGAVATIHGQDVRREEFAEYLIRKYGAKEIELFVNQKIIEAEAKKRGVSVTDEEVELAFLRAIDQLKMTKADFVRTVLAKYGKAENEWREDVLRQQLLLEKLSRDTAEAATDFDARNLFELKYGERRRVQLIQWASEEQAREMHPRVKKEPLLFEQFGVRVQQANKPEERFVTFDKGPNAYGGNSVKVAVFNLKLDEVSELIPLEKGWCTVRLVEIVPPAKDKKFDDEKAALLEEANRMRLQMAVPKRFEEIKKDAKPVYHIQPEPKTYSVPLPLPAKK